MDNARTPSDRVAGFVQEFRQSQGMSVTHLAKRCADLGMPELTAQVIYKIEGRRKAPSGRPRPVTVDELVVLARALGVPVGRLLYGDDAVRFPSTAPEAQAVLRQLADLVEDSVLFEDGA